MCKASGMGRERVREGRGGYKVPAPETDVANFSIFIISALVFWRLPYHTNKKENETKYWSICLRWVSSQELCSSFSCSWQATQLYLWFNKASLPFVETFLWQIKHKYEVRKITISRQVAPLPFPLCRGIRYKQHYNKFKAPLALISNLLWLYFWLSSGSGSGSALISSGQLSNIKETKCSL